MESIVAPVITFNNSSSSWFIVIVNPVDAVFAPKVPTLPVKLPDELNETDVIKLPDTLPEWWFRVGSV